MPPAPPDAPPPDRREPPTARAVLLLVTIRDVAKVRELLTARFGATESEADRAIRQAREQISLAAIPDFAEEIGKAKATYEKIVELAFRKKDTKTAILAQDKLAELLRLNEPGRLEDLSGVLKEESDDLVRRHLAGIVEVAPGTPLEELARRVALKFTEEASDEELRTAQTGDGGSESSQKPAGTRRRAAASDRIDDAAG